MSQVTETHAIEFIIGATVVCDDGPLGKLRRVVVNPIARTITHLVVEPRHRRASGHLVPVDIVTAATPEEIRLSCSESEFAAMDDAEEIQFVSGAGDGWSYAQSQMLTMPYFPLGAGMGMAGQGIGSTSQTLITDRIPVGDVQVQRGDAAHATDGAIGRVRGLVVDATDHAVTHILLDEGHLWGTRHVAIPIASVTRVDDDVRVALTKEEIGDLPTVDFDDVTGQG